MLLRSCRYLTASLISKLDKGLLGNLEISDAVKKLQIPSFRGVFVRDMLPSKPNKNESGILNLDRSLGDGTHWTAWYRRNNKNFYFER